MNNNEITKEIERLTAEGINLLLKIENLKINEVLIHSLDYQNWYTESLAIVRQLFPERAQEFIEFYELKKTSDDFNLEAEHLNMEKTYLDLNSVELFYIQSVFMRIYM